MLKQTIQSLSFNHLRWPVLGLAVVILGAAALVLVNRQPAPTAAQGEFPALATLPAVPEPLDNPITPEKVELGRLLFFDPRMSADGSMSCNSCHSAATGYGATTAISFGGPGTSHWRNASTLLNVAYYTKLNWDGAKKSIEQQNSGAWGGAVAGNLDKTLAEERLAQIPEYVKRFKDVFGAEYPRWDDALKAVATYQRTLVSRNVPFDAFLEGDESAISDAAKRGYELFQGEAGCIACHNGFLVSDDSYHATGVPTNPDFLNSPLKQITFRYEQWAKGATEYVYRTTSQDYGLYYVTKQDVDQGKFRTPSLRDLCYTAPYMHNGVFTSLEEVVAFYNDGGGKTPNKSELISSLNLSTDEQSDLVAFMESLCGEQVSDEAPELPPYGVFSVSK